MKDCKFWQYLSEDKLHCTHKKIGVIELFNTPECPLVQCMFFESNKKDYEKKVDEQLNMFQNRWCKSTQMRSWVVWILNALGDLTNVVVDYDHEDNSEKIEERLIWLAAACKSMWEDQFAVKYEKDDLPF